MLWAEPRAHAVTALDACCSVAGGCAAASRGSQVPWLWESMPCCLLLSISACVSSSALASSMSGSRCCCSGWVHGCRGAWRAGPGLALAGGSCLPLQHGPAAASFDLPEHGLGEAPSFVPSLMGLSPPTRQPLQEDELQGSSSQPGGACSPLGWEMGSSNCGCQSALHVAPGSSVPRSMPGPAQAGLACSAACSTRICSQYVPGTVSPQGGCHTVGAA